jgi:hypothetical protein
MAGKQYEVIAPFRAIDPEGGPDVHYAPEGQGPEGVDSKSVYSGDTTVGELDYLKGHDHNGPLIKEKAPSSSSGSSSSASSSSADSASKEK